MTISVEAFSGLVRGIQEAALESSLWPAALHQLFSAVGCNGGGVLLVQPDRQRLDTANSDLDPEATAAYNAYYGRIDVVAANMRQAPTGSARKMGEIMPWPEILRTEIYNDWAIQFELCDGLFVPVLQQGMQSYILCLMLNRRGDLFENSDVLKLIGMILPHLRQALCVQEKLAVTTRARDNARDILEHARHGVILTAAGGKIQFANSAAVAILDQRDGLLLGERHLRAKRASEESALRRLIGQADGQGADSFRAGGSLMIDRPSGRRPFVVHVLPLGKDKQDFTEATASVLVVIVDPEREPETDVSNLQRLYGLTRAEAAVAVEIMRGDGLQSAAEALSVSLSTVRTHQQRVFEKTGAHRQAELVRLLLGARVGLG